MTNLLLTRIEMVTGVSNLDGMSWEDVVLKVVLPRMAGPKGTRWCVNDQFMNFVADNVNELVQKDMYIAQNLLEVGLQRITCGACPHHEYTFKWLEMLPEKYWDYSSRWDEEHVLSDGCYNFFMKATEACFYYDKLRKHVAAILLGFMDNTTPEGEVSSLYYAIADHKKDVPKMFALAEQVAEKYLSFNELYACYARPTQWRKHINWFAKNYDKIDWNKFFVDTQSAQGNLFKRWKQKREIKQEIKNAMTA